MFKFRQCSKCKSIHLFKRAFQRYIRYDGGQRLDGRFYTICKGCASRLFKETLYKKGIGELE